MIIGLLASSFTEIPPRNVIEVPSFPGREEVRVIVRPGMVPCSAEATLCVDFPASTSSPFT